MKRVKGQRYLYRRGRALVFRRSVPKPYREAFGKSEVVATLSASTETAACREMLQHLSRFESELSRARNGCADQPICAPDVEQIEYAVRCWFSDRQRRLSAPGIRMTRPQRSDRLTELAAYEENVREVVVEGDPSAIHSRWIAETVAERSGWKMDRNSDAFGLLMRTVARAQLEASRREREDLEGMPRTAGDQTFSDEAYSRDQSRGAAAIGAHRLTDLFQGYVSERRPAAATVKAWKRQLNHLIAYLGHQDASRVTPADIVGWKDELLSKQSRRGTPLTAKTVNDTYLSVVRTIFNWGVENEKVPSNPAARVRVRPQRRVVTRAKGLTLAEAHAILRATLRPPASRLSSERVFARRWVPWLCAYTGARVNEITQLRAEDVLQIGKIPVLRITPEAGSVKNYRARVVPLHPHLIEQGFLTAVEGKEGPLFYDRSRHRGGSDGNPQSKKVGEHLAAWVRELGVNDPEVQPNHGWRHRFKTEARNVGMNPEVRDAIQGHATRTEGEAYGDFSPEAMLREIKKLPRYRVLRPSVRQNRSRARGTGST